MTKSTTLFLVLAIVFSWFLYWPAINSAEPLANPLMLALYILASFGPGIAALLVQWHTSGIGEVKALLKKLIDLERQPKWLIASIALPCVFLLITVIIISYTQGISFSAISIGRWLLTIPTLILNLFLFGVLSSALAWQGYFLPQLQNKYSALVASLFVGLAWGLWQVPTLYIEGVFGIYQSIAWMFLEMIALAIILTWFYNSTGSLFYGVIFNTLYLTIGQTISPAIQLSKVLQDYQHITAIILVNFALLLVIFCGKDLIFKKPQFNSNN